MPHNREVTHHDGPTTILDQPMHRTRSNNQAENKDSLISPPRSIQQRTQISFSYQYPADSVLSSSPENDNMSPTRIKNMEAEKAFDTIEAEIDTLKREVLLLRKESSQDLVATKDSASRLPRPTYASRQPAWRSKTLSFGKNQNKSQESPAARLQRQHEELEEKAGQQSDAYNNSCQPETASSTSRAFQFPALTTASPLRQTDNVSNSTSYSQVPRKASYAQVVETGKTTIETYTGPQNATQSISSPAAVKSPVSKGAGLLTTPMNETPPKSWKEEAKNNSTRVTTVEDDGSVFEYGSSLYSELAGCSGNTSPLKSSPHFAQPTKSSESRCDGVVRKSNISTIRRNTLQSTLKPENAHLTRTEKCVNQSHQKRKSLPGNWLPNTKVQQEQDDCGDVRSDGYELYKTMNNHKALAHTNASPHGAYIVEPWSDEDTERWAQSCASIDRKGHSRSRSYMAPTVAALQRASATSNLAFPRNLRPESCAKPTNLRIDTQVAHKHSSTKAEDSVTSCAGEEDGAVSSSDASSMVFILEGSNSCSMLRAQGSQLPVSENGQSPQMNSTAQLSDHSTYSEPKVVQSLPNAGHVEDSTKQDAAERPIIKAATNIDEVPQPTTGRRISRASLLEPIVRSLERQGLLNQCGNQHNSVVKSYYRAREAKEAENTEPGVLEKDSMVGIGRGDLQTSEHRPEIGHSNGESGTMATELDNTETQIRPTTSSPPKYSAAADSIACLQSWSASNGGTYHPSGSLRATAKVFAPENHPAEHLVSDPEQFPWGEYIRYHPHVEWSRYPKAVRDSITILRAYNAGVDWRPSQLFARRVTPETPSKGQQRPQSSVMMMPGTFQTGQETQLAQTSSTGEVHWIVCDPHCGKAPPNLPSSITPWHGLPTPPASVSTASDASPSMYTIYGSEGTDGWTIESIASHHPFAWAGGNGKEIKFSGHASIADETGRDYIIYSDYVPRSVGNKHVHRRRKQQTALKVSSNKTPQPAQGEDECMIQENVALGTEQSLPPHEWSRPGCFW